MNENQTIENQTTRAKTKLWLLIAIIAMLIWSCIYKFVTYTSHKEIMTGELSTIKDNVYVQTYSVYSNIPANNTSVAIICMDDQLYKISGHITIKYTDETPHYEYTKTNIVNGDELNIWVPRGTVQRLENQTSK